MILTTHMRIARLVHQHLKKTEGVSLHLQSFIYGNIKPDLKADFYPESSQNKVEHYPHTSLDFVMDKLKFLETEVIKGVNLSSQPFATELGHLCHYFSDYFCYVHAVNYDIPLKSHLLYEFKLADEFAKLYHNFSSLDNIFSDVHESSATILTHFKALQHEYIKASPNLKTDAYFALSMSNILVRSVVLGFSRPRRQISA